MSQTKQTLVISNKKDYQDFLRSDALAMGINPSSRKDLIKAHFSNPRWRFIKKLRRVEYYSTLKKNPVYLLIYLVVWYNYKRYALKLGFSIPANVCGPGLSLPHYGTLVISKEAVIGKNARIHICVNIGASKGGAPIIGDNVYIGPGAKIFGPIRIGNNVQIGANAVVNQSFEEDDIVLAGVPARIVKKLTKPSISVE